MSYLVRLTLIDAELRVLLALSAGVVWLGTLLNAWTRSVRERAEAIMKGES